MKNTIIKNLTAAMAIAVLCAVSYAQNAKRIDFTKDGPSLVWEERVAANSGKEFVFYAKKGQKLTINFIDDTNQASMDLGKVSIEPNSDPYEEVISVSKDYRLSVSNNSNKSTSFRISITLEDVVMPMKPSADPLAGSPAPNTERVKFSKDIIELNLERTVQANDAKRFVFAARQGQEVNLTVTPARKNANLMIDINNVSITKGAPFKMEIPKSGDYTLQILNADGQAQPFTLDVSLTDVDRSTDATYISGPSPSGERVRFANGETSAMVTRDIPAGGSIDFVIGVRKGQTLGYTVGYDFKDSDIRAFLTEPGMQDISKTSGPKEPQEFMIKKSGDHRLTVSNTTRKKLTITLYVDVE
jgi:hypothetical protein